MTAKPTDGITAEEFPHLFAAMESDPKLAAELASLCLVLMAAGQLAAVDSVQEHGPELALPALVAAALEMYAQAVAVNPLAPEPGVLN